MTLNELIRSLERVERKTVYLEGSDAEKEKPVYYDFCDTHPTTISSWRGAYALPALGWDDGDWYREREPNRPPTVSELIAELRSSLGKVFEGWKGGEYTYNGSEVLHVANPGKCGATLVDGVSDEGWCIVIRTRYEEDAW